VTAVSGRDADERAEQTGDRWSHVGRDNSGAIITGDNNTYYAGEDPRATAAKHFAAGVQHLDLGLRREAVEDFRLARASDPRNQDAYYLGAVAQLDGKKAFLASLQCIRESEELIQGAIGLEDRGIFYYFLAYVRFDYYERKFLRAPAPWQLSFVAACSRGLTQGQIDSLFKLLSVENPLPVLR
jgi:hypothetical protein